MFSFHINCTAPFLQQHCFWELGTQMCLVGGAHHVFPALFTLYVSFTEISRDWRIFKEWIYFVIFLSANLKAQQKPWKPTFLALLIWKVYGFGFYLKLKSKVIWRVFTFWIDNLTCYLWRTFLGILLDFNRFYKYFKNRIKVKAGYFILLWVNFILEWNLLGFN